MSWIDHIVERQIQEGMRRGEFDGLPGAGRPLDLDPREPGWWAKRLVDAERSRLRHDEVREDLTRRRARFWFAADLVELREQVTTANKMLAEANAVMEPADRFELVDWAETADTWRKVRVRR